MNLSIHRTGKKNDEKRKSSIPPRYIRKFSLNLNKELLRNVPVIHDIIPHFSGRHEFEIRNRIHSVGLSVCFVCLRDHSTMCSHSLRFYVWAERSEKKQASSSLTCISLPRILLGVPLYSTHIAYSDRAPGENILLAAKKFPTDDDEREHHQEDWHERLQMAACSHKSPLVPLFFSFFAFVSR